jgi:hypothetical protein
MLPVKALYIYVEMMGYLPVDQMIEVRAVLENAGMRALAKIQGQSSNDQGGFAGRPPNSFVARGTVYVSYILCTQGI